MYNLNAIKEKIEQLTNAKKYASKDSETKRPKLTWFKPGLGQYSVRFLPYTDANGQPFQEVAYYDSKLLSEMRFVAPSQWGMKDPVFELLTELRKDRSKEAWKLWKNLQPKERYYAPIIVRGEEEKGVQIWELNSRLVKDIYSILAHPDYSEENLMDPDKGYDFTVTVSPTDKTFNGNPVKEIKLQPRRKPSKLSENEAQREKFLAGIPDLEAYFKAQVKSVDEMANMLENFLNSSNSSGASDAQAEEATESPSSSDDSSVNSAKVKKARKSIDDAFDDL
jgi:hypothetical protein